MLTIKDFTISLALASLAACATPLPPGDDGLPPAREFGGSCDTDGLDRFIGETATQALGAEILAASGARSLRWGPPNSAMTMDYRTDRLNIFYDSDMAIERITCG